MSILVNGINGENYNSGLDFGDIAMGDILSDITFSDFGGEALNQSAAGLD